MTKRQTNVRCYHPIEGGGYCDGKMRFADDVRTMTEFWDCPKCGSKTQEDLNVDFYARQKTVCDESRHTVTT